MRLFVAVDPPPAVLDHLAAFAAGLGLVRAGARVTARRLWHVTVAFLGEVPQDRLPVAIGALDTAAASVARGYPRPVARLAGGGRFDTGRFTIVWADVQDDLAPLRRATTGALDAATLPYDAQRFQPHLTLGRPGARVPPEVIDADLAALAGYQGPQWTISTLTLYRGQPSPGQTYTPVHRAPVSPPVGENQAGGPAQPAPTLP